MNVGFPPPPSRKDRRRKRSTFRRIVMNGRRLGESVLFQREGRKEKEVEAKGAEGKLAGEVGGW